MHVAPAPELLSTHAVAAALGYTHDYIARMCREGKMAALRVGPQWMVDPAEVDRFQKAHENRLRSTRDALIETRKRERAAHAPQVLEIAVAPNAHRAHQALFRLMQETVAVSAALIITCGSVAVAESGLVARAADSLVATGYVAADGLSLIVSEGAENWKREAIAARALYPEGTYEIAYADPRALALPEIEPVYTAQSFVFSPDMPVSPIAIDARVTARTELKDIPRMAGAAALGLGIGIRDWGRLAPGIAFKNGAKLGAFFVGATDAVLAAYLEGIYRFAALPEPIARGTITSVASLGSTTRTLVAYVPALAHLAYDSSVSFVASAGPAIAGRIVRAEIAFGHTLVDASSYTSAAVLSSFTSGAQLAIRAYEEADGVLPKEEFTRLAQAAATVFRDTGRYTASALTGVLQAAGEQFDE